MLDNNPWIEFVDRKFNSKWFVPLIAHYSSLDFEYFFRKVYEFTYQLECDRGHAKWNYSLAVNSIIFEFKTGERHLDKLAFNMHFYKNFDLRELKKYRAFII